MSSLADLDLSFNHFEEANPLSFSGLCSLRFVKLSINNLSGQVSKFVQILSACTQNSLQRLYLNDNNLTVLFLSNNQLGGRIPESIGQMSKLEDISFGMNSLEGVISERLQFTLSETHFSKLSKLIYLDLSSNSLGLNLNSNWVPPYQLDHINLGSCKMGPYFPKWLQTQRGFTYLDIHDVGISNILPSWFWDLSCNVTFISLSHNQIGEMFANLTVDFTNYPELHLSSNQIEGPTPATLSHASYLNLSNNNISGLSFLNLSSNNGNFQNA
ncbi:unnamed protein product [Malus baccata var. baccata]